MCRTVKYKFLNKEYEDSFALNVTETDFRHYDSALGRFNVMDMLSELAPNYTPYRYGFNNPVFWQDATGLFESYQDAEDFLWKNKLKGKIDFLNGKDESEGFVVTVIGGEFDGQMFYAFYSELKSSGGNGGGSGDGGGPSSRNPNPIGSSNGVLEGVQTALDVAGLVPGIGEIADGINAIIYAVNGDYVNASLSLAAMVPIGGQLATAGKLGMKVADVASTAYRPISNTVKAVGDGIPNSVYNYMSKDGHVVSKYFYNDAGKVDFQIDFRDTNSIFGVHGHSMSIPGILGSGHMNGHHVPFMLIPKKYW